MWPLLGVEVAHRLGIENAPPAWLQNEYAILWRSTTPNLHGEAPDWHSKTVSVVDLPMSRFLAQRFFAHSKFDPTPNRTVAFQHVCPAVRRGPPWKCAWSSRLLERPRGCEGISLGLRVIPGMTQSMTLVATRPFRAPADELRAEIGVMFLDGRFGEFVDNWSYSPISKLVR